MSNTLKKLTDKLKRIDLYISQTEKDLADSENEKARMLKTCLETYKRIRANVQEARDLEAAKIGRNK